MRVILAEKPSVALDIAKALGKPERHEGYVMVGDTAITWAFGHLVSLAAPETYNTTWKKWSWATLPMLPEAFRLEPIKKTKPQLTVIKKLFKEADRVVAATDADREGQYIFATIASVAGLSKPVDRLWLSENTPAAIRKALASMKPNTAYDNLTRAAAARSQADWLVGLNATRAFSLRHGQPGQPLSVGRVQTPTLRLIADRDNAIEGFQPTPYWELQVTFQLRPGEYVGRWLGPDKEHPHRILAEGEAQLLAAKVPAGTPGQISSAETKPVTVRAPLLYSLNDLQKDANRRLGLTAQQTLDAAQRLYDSHLISYPRTDAQYITEEISREIPARLGALTIGTRALRDQAVAHAHQKAARIINDAKVNKAGHYAIIPTDQVPGDKLSAMERGVYELVCRRFLAALLPDGKDERTTVITVAAGEQFRTTGTAVVEPGWRKALQPIREDDDKDVEESEALIPPGLTAGMAVVVMDSETKGKQTKPPVRLSDASLLAMMEKHGLGTPATRARIVEVLLIRGYVERQKTLLVSTDKGRHLLKLVPDQLQSPELTGQWESRLEAIADGQGHADEFLQGIRELTRAVVDVAKGQQSEAVATISTFGPCPKCREGIIRDVRKGWGCSRWQEGCDFIIWRSVSGKKLTETQVKTLVAGRTTAELKGFKSKAGKSFSARLKLDEQFHVVFEFGSGARQGVLSAHREGRLVSHWSPTETNGKIYAKGVSCNYEGL